VIYLLARELTGFRPGLDVVRGSCAPLFNFSRDEQYAIRRSPMSYDENIAVVVDAEVCLHVATAQVARVSVINPVDQMRRELGYYRFDLCLTSRPGNARACYSERWSSHRFERIGNLFVFPAGEVVHTKSDVAPEQTSVICHIHPDTMSEWFDGDITWTERRLERCLDIRNSNIRNLLVRLADEVLHPGLASELFAASITAELGIELVRHCNEIKEGPARGGLAAWRLRRIDERLNELREAPTLPELSQLCNLSVRALTRGFRVSRGISIGEHVSHRRTEHAKLLLAAGHSAKSAAYAVGFTSAASFSAAFHRATGETPSDFRSRMYWKRGSKSVHGQN
jgi:AraC family transcriptional regulator